MNEVDKILYQLGFYNADDMKKQQIQGYIDEANEFLIDAGVPKDKILSARAHAIRSLWADSRDKGQSLDLVGNDKMIVNLIAQLRH